MGLLRGAAGGEEGRQGVAPLAIVAEKKLRFVFSFFGLVDLLAILPFYVTTGLDLRSIRVFRLLRLFRIFKVTRYNTAANRFKVAFGLVRAEIVLFFTVTLILLYVSAVGIYYFENPVQPDDHIPTTSLDDSGPYYDYVTVVDVKIPFWSMVALMVKSAIAAIPALIILGVIGALVLASFGVLGQVIRSSGG